MTVATSYLFDLPLHHSPFFVLGVSSRDGRQRIVEAADEKALTIDAEMCSKARVDLTNPRNRLPAEIAWLPGLSPRRAQQMFDILSNNPRAVIDIEVLPPMAHANLVASALLTISPDTAENVWVHAIMRLAMLTEQVNADDLLRDINEDRKVAAFPEVKSVDLVHEAISERRREFRNGIKRALDGLIPIKLATVVSQVIDEATMNGARQAPILIDEMVDAYAVETHSFLHKEAENVRALITRAKEAAPRGDRALAPLLTKLESVLRNWKMVAYPIQVSTKSRGMVHEMSRDLARDVRGFGIDLYNDYRMLDASKRIVTLLQDVFNSVPEVAERVSEDVQTLDGLASEQHIDPIMQACVEAINAAEKNPEAGERTAREMLATTGNMLAEVIGKNVPQETIQEARDMIGLALMRCAVAFGKSTGKWGLAIPLLKEASNLVKEAKISALISENLSAAYQNDRVFGGLKSIDGAPLLFTINGFGVTIYGNSDYDHGSRSYLTTYYFTALFFPLFPICRYRVISTNDGYRFLGKAPLRTFDRCHLVLFLFGVLWLITQMR